MSAMNIGDIILEVKITKDRIIPIEPFKWCYFDEAGIWLLFGSNDNSGYKCLDAGWTRKIGQEIIYDMGCLSYVEYSNKSGKPYINQFGEDCGFKCVSDKTQECLYPFLAENYNRLMFVYAFDGTLSSDNELRAKEKELAHLFHALYWRNGRAFIKPCAENRKITCFKDIDDIKRLLDGAKS